MESEFSVYITSTLDFEKCNEKINLKKKWKGDNFERQTRIIRIIL